MFLVVNGSNLYLIERFMYLKYVCLLLISKTKMSHSFWPKFGTSGHCAHSFFLFCRWTFNNSAEAKTVSSRFIRTNGSTSLLTFTPTRTLEYGTLMCWSRNSVGEQRDPCIFHIIAAGNILLETIPTEREPIQ